MQDPDRRDDINLQAPRFLLACTTGSCPHCGALTPIYALALPPGHRVLEPAADAGDGAADGAGDEPADEPAADTWRVAPNNAFLFHVEFLDRVVRHRLESLATSYRPPERDEGCANANANANADERWANHCGSCGAPLDDEELFCEPDVGFMPATAAGAARIRLVAVECAFAAVAAGYVPDPAWFDAMG